MIRIHAWLCAAFISVGLLASPLAFAQRRASQTPNPFPPATMAELNDIRNAALASDYAWRELAHLTNSIGPRLSGSPQAAAAVEYVAGELRQLGLDVRLQRVMVPHWVRGAESASLVEYPGQVPGTSQKVVLTALGGSVSTPADGLTADVVVVNNFDELDALGAQQVAGKIVLFNEKYDKRMAEQGLSFPAYSQAVRYRGEGASAAAKLGAVAALVRSVGSADFRLPHTGALNYQKDVAKIPAAAVTAEDAEMIAALAADGRVRMHLLLTPQTLPDEPSYNVIADLKGTEHPEQVVIVSGHLDSWDLGTGAMDDGVGVAVAMEAAHILTQLHLRPKRTLRVIAWINEENGGAGGRGYAKEYLAEMGSLFAAIESDSGAGHPAGFNARVRTEDLPDLAWIAKALEPIGATIARVSDDTGADISRLAAAGVPTFSPIQDGRAYFHYHHTPADTLDKVVPRELAENAAVMAVLGYALANFPRDLPHLPPVIVPQN
ncbi:MAG TPA: M20/M25/M40 family metallo-hydrolase [Terriglobales bacterium]|nr:M20/M25/M40 family metallo-hydrolase [Terriglobales bacterium]